jgi:hypothetical protein
MLADTLLHGHEAAVRASDGSQPEYVVTEAV